MVQLKMVEQNTQEKKKSFKRKQQRSLKKKLKKGST